VGVDDDVGRRRLGDDDLSLLGELRTLVERADPVPERVRRAARQSLASRAAEAELAWLAFDSVADHAGAAPDGGGARRLTFAGPDLTVAVAVAAAGGRRHLTGRLVPPAAAEVEVSHPGGTLTVEADASGRFAAAELPPGPVRLRCQLRRAQPAPPVVTDWVSL
jgi:hypothetical protein